MSDKDSSKLDRLAWIVTDRALEGNLKGATPGTATAGIGIALLAMTHVVPEPAKTFAQYAFYVLIVVGVGLLVRWAVGESLRHRRSGFPEDESSNSNKKTLAGKKHSRKK